MKTDRRFMLRLATASALGWTAVPGRAVPMSSAEADNSGPLQAIRPHVVGVVAGHVLDSAFVSGVAEHVRERGFVLDDTVPLRGLQVQSFSRLLRPRGAPLGIVGLLDDAHAAIAVELLRAQGASFQVLLQLTLRPGNIDAELARMLGRRLAAGEEPQPSGLLAGGEPRVAFACLV